MFSLEKRPRTFSKMIGHEKIINGFKNRSKNGNYPQVMLFVGQPGSGKNTIAYIIAKLINCDNPENNGTYNEPCNKCKSCMDINNEYFSRDVRYADCTQYDSKDVESLNKSALLSPMYDKSKIFILDEFQSLGNSKTKSKTNNLLEKPRKNVFFLLCARETKSIPSDLLQRCQIYNFYPIPSKDIGDYLCELIIDIPDIDDTFFKEGIHTIANNSKGSVRLALQFLERCINEKIFSSEEIEKELGFISKEKEMDILYSLLDTKKEGLEYLKDLKNLESFYFKTKKILISASIYKFTKKVDQKWQEQNAKIISGKSNLFELLRCYSFDYYFNEDQFLYKVINYYNSNYVNNIREVRK